MRLLIIVDSFFVMASSRWKRFAFFERHTLNLTTDVLEDVIPVESDVAKSRRSLRSLQDLGQEAGDDSIDLVSTTAALPLASQPSTSEEEKQPDEYDDAMAAMWSTLTACTSPSVPAGSDEQNSDKVVQLPSQDNDLLASSGAADAAALDGLVLTFITSRYTELVHCLDVTVRCNPPSSSAENNSLEDLDGWRGYFAPFAKVAAEQQQQDDTSRAAPESSSRVLALAACRDVLGHKPVLMACIAKDKLVVWEDPHLHLSCRRPLTSPKLPAEAKLYTLQSAWNASDGECRAVDIVPSLVAVGTSGGYVIVFSYNSSSATKRVLRTYLRIPPPPTGETEVVSVKLSRCEDDEDDKASVFVAYRRKATEATAASAGICCYEMPLPTTFPAALISAPSARHDLDGRSVGSASLVDAFPTCVGLRLTVVCKKQTLAFLGAQDHLLLSQQFAPCPYRHAWMDYIPIPGQSVLA